MSDRTQGGRKPRPGSARWRQQQRKERQTDTAKATPNRGRVRQALPASGVKLPEIDIPTKTLRLTLYPVIGLVLVFGMIYTLRLFNPPEASALPNGIWLSTNWTYDLPSNEQVANLVERMRTNRIGTGYVWVTQMKDDLTWGGKTADFDPVTREMIGTVNPLTGDDYRNDLAEMEPNIIRFVEQFNEAYPEGQLFAWVNLPSGVVPLDDETIRTRVAELAVLLVTDYGFDGVKLDVAPVASGDQNYVQLLRTVRLALDDVTEAQNLDSRVPLAAAIPPDWRPSNPNVPYSPTITGVLEWDLEYKQTVALIVDEMLINAFNSGLERPVDYSTWVAYQTRAYAEAVAPLGVETDVLIGVPTYPAQPPLHDPRVENLEAAVPGVESGLLQAGEASEAVRGLAIFVEFATDDGEWAAFQLLWGSPPQQGG
jgi:hypothetical protein